MDDLFQALTPTPSSPTCKSPKCRKRSTSLKSTRWKPQPQNPTKNEAADSPRFVPRLLGLLPLVGQAQQDTLDMDVTFVGKRTMEVQDAVKLSSWPMAGRCPRRNPP